MTGSSTLRGDEAGFTLVETVVAFAILALVVTTAIQVVGGGSVRARLAADRDTALVHAQSQLALLGATAQLPLGTSNGEFADGFEWRLEAVPALGSSPASQSLVPWNVEIEVARQGVPAGRIALRTVMLARAPGERP